MTEETLQETTIIEEKKDTLCMMCENKSKCTTAIFFDWEKMYCDEFSKDKNINF